VINHGFVGQKMSLKSVVGDPFLHDQHPRGGDDAVGNSGGISQSLDVIEGNTLEL
jgi:hypothetical protein